MVEDLIAATPRGRTAKLVAVGVGALPAIALLGFVMWWFFVRPRAARIEAAGAHAEAVVAAHGEQAATAAIGITRDVIALQRAVDRLTEENDHAIRSATDAATRNPAVARALHDALCLRDAYKLEPDCSAVQTAGGRLRPAEGDAGGAPAGQ
jgi:type II secretory pathway component PulM